MNLIIGTALAAPLTLVVHSDGKTAIDIGSLTPSRGTCATIRLEHAHPELLLQVRDSERRSLAYDRVRSIDREITTVELLDGDYTLLVSGPDAAAESFPFRIRQGEPCIVDIHLRQPIPIELALDASALDKNNMPTALIQIEEDGRLVTEDTVTPQSTRRPTLHALSLGAGTYTCTILNQRTRKTMATTTLTVAAGAPSQFPIALR